MEPGEQMVSEETQRTIIQNFEESLKEFNENYPDDKEEDTKYFEELKVLVRVGTVKDVVQAFINETWDLPSFTRWVYDHVENHTDAKNLLAEGTLRQHEWST